MEAAVSQRLGEEVGEGMSRASASRPPPQLPPPASGSGGRLAVLASHLSQSSRTAGEKEAALAAGPSDGPTIFDKILRKEIPSQVVYEDEKAEERHVEVMGHLLYAAKTIAKQENLDDGFRIVINDGPNGCEHKLDPIETGDVR
ncbi:putative protein kinase C inhibitor [Oryza sativa Japonica Group]|uniref:Uncharacterized protein n=1 Tax=Oryza sativa subsp. japonica TaxID=39947 RepID=Q5VQQ9_ORYSJ|nr:putative protein kinase C inhibitor [Oryza sativa Japonica Group]BAD82678.1 putative protein kinase C inhibitor [Oryza sativa Japonica Group]